MRDFLNVYFSWLAAIGRESNFEYFTIWLWTLTESQLDEVAKKYEPHNKELLSIIDANYNAYDMKIMLITQSIKNCRVEYSLLGNAELASPLCNITYVKDLIDVHFGDKHWHDLDIKSLERATVFYNDFDRYDGMIIGLFWNEKISQECRDLLAERFLLKNEV